MSGSGFEHDRAGGVEYGPGSSEALQADLDRLFVETPAGGRVIDHEGELALLGRLTLWSFSCGGGFRSHVISMNMGCDTMIPMANLETIQSDLTAAMKAGDEVKKTTLRSVLTAIKTAQANAGAGTELSDEQIQKLIATEIKQRTEAAEIFADAGEAERAAKEVAERDVLQAYMPEQLSAEEVDALVAQVIADGGYSTKKEMGSAIKDVMAKAGGAVDGKTVSQAVGKALS